MALHLLIAQLLVAILILLHVADESDIGCCDIQPQLANNTSTYC